MRKLKLLKDIFSQLGTPTSASLAELAELKRDCLLREDPNSFYTTINLLPERSIEWHHNRKDHLGLEAYDYASFIAHVHPDWFPFYLGFTIGAHQTLYADDFSLSHKDCVYMLNVPLRHPDGSYHWYNQMSVAVGFDENDAMTMHLNHYHHLCEYDMLVPQSPVFMVHGEIIDWYNEPLRQAVEPLLHEYLAGILSPSLLAVLYTYRELVEWETTWILPKKSTVRSSLKMSATALDKAIVRILKEIKFRFPERVTHDVAEFACFLNELSGFPSLSGK